MNSVVFCLDALARNSDGRHGGALGTAAAAASLRAAPYRTDATGERALNSVVTAGFPRMPLASDRLNFINRTAWLPVAIATGACRSLQCRPARTIERSQRASAVRQHVSLGGRVPDEFQINVALTVDPLVRAEVQGQGIDAVTISADRLAGAGEAGPNVLSRQSVETHRGKNSSIVLHDEIPLFALSNNGTDIRKRNWTPQRQLFDQRKAELGGLCGAIAN